jgi:hypothetical protein
VLAPAIVGGAAAPAARVAAATATGMRHDLLGRAGTAGFSRVRRRRRAGLGRLRVYGEAAGKPTLPALIVAITLCRLTSLRFGMPQAYPIDSSAPGFVTRSARHPYCFPECPRSSAG